MNLELKKNKHVLRSFMREQYSDEKLIQLLDHARAGKLAFQSCCCFIGTLTAPHRLRGKARDIDGLEDIPHIELAREILGAYAAELAYRYIGVNDEEWATYIIQNGSREPIEWDRRRRAIIIPMILAELKRRNRFGSEAQRSEQTKILSERRNHERIDHR